MAFVSGKKDYILKPFMVKILLAVSSSILIVLSYPAPDQGWVAWVALVPLIISLKKVSIKTSFSLGLIAGIGAGWGIFHWLFQVPGFRVYHGMTLSVYFGMYFGLWTLGINILKRAGIPLYMISASLLWIFIEYMRAHAGFLAIPWATLAQSQYRNLPVLQIASITGEFGISFLLILFNLALAESLMRRKMRPVVITAFVIIPVFVWGTLQIKRADSTQKEISIAVVQPAILPEERDSEEGLENSLSRLERLTEAVISLKPSLIVWPETAIKATSSGTESLSRVKKLVNKYRIPILTGISVTEKLSQKTPGGFQISDRLYNSAFLLTTGRKPLSPYKKMILVPFGEYLPLHDRIKWPDWIIKDPVDLTPGDQYVIYNLNSIRIGPIICWENMFSGHVRGLVQKGVDVVVHLTNDYWFGKTAAPFQHNIASVIRAVENRIPIVTVSNTGPSMVIDSEGRITKRSKGFFAEESFSANIAVSEVSSFYARHGSMFIKGTFLFFVFLLSQCRRSPLILNRVFVAGSSKTTEQCMFRKTQGGRDETL